MTASKRVAALFLVALVGVLVVVGIVVAEVGGLPALLGYVAVALALLGLGVVQLRRLAPAPQPQASHCTCCDGDHTAPVKVI